MISGKQMDALIRKMQKKVDRDIKIKNHSLEQRIIERGCDECSLDLCKKCSECSDWHDAFLKFSLKF